MHESSSVEQHTVHIKLLLIYMKFFVVQELVHEAYTELEDLYAWLRRSGASAGCMTAHRARGGCPHASHLGPV